MNLHKLSPILWTKDLAATISFYENVLGFKGTSNFPSFVSLTRGSVEIMFVVPQEDEDNADAENKNGEFFPKPMLTGSLFITTDNVDELWDSVKDNSGIVNAIADRQYLMRDFAIRDNNGYVVVFGQDISSRQK